MKKPDFGFTEEELRILRKLRTPVKVQDFVNSLEENFEKNGETCMSPRKVLRERKAHCVEGALLASVALRLQGHKPLIVDLNSAPGDDDHVLAVFRKAGKWGAITKTNHAVLRYREPIYRDIRELAISFFHEYFLNSNGKKTLRSFSMPIDLSRFDRQNWMTSEKNLWFITDHLAGAKHINLLSRKAIRGLRPADPIEIEAGKLVEYRE
ncbi:hypothetical protein CO038_01400 [Candidatus Pacearchaeota archaeon CG_4_9_14_0_2_um_filter_39_13]|nr:hypothetical protein [Candidatus Pacearchaeota archaeon]OIO43769.1 MAG: hypothetical protein AUJ64_01650 [Candidatus Pacearchaeota archaeon CG1_02_39_14]PJC44864.1 MAG: hypothetical protein CO038_01400 [Candidatus Pacearchaeota archaeon CG_4_9_14_0_2_um_filter_39_13]